MGRPIKVADVAKPYEEFLQSNKNFGSPIFEKLNIHQQEFPHAVQAYH